MSIETNERPPQAAAIGSSEHNRIVASRWIDAFNARDDAAEAAARTADHVASPVTRLLGNRRRTIAS